MSRIRVLLVDDHPVFRQGLRDVLETDPRMEVVGEAADGEIAMELAEQRTSDVILMDINLPTINGLQVTRRIKTSRPNVKVVMLTGYDEVEQVLHALRAGANAYCPKDITPELLIRTIVAVNEGKYVVGEKEMDYDEVVKWVEKRVGRDIDSLTTASGDYLTPLTPREMEILELVTRGLSNKVIALQLGISHQTVKNHMTSILRKLHVDDRTQAAVYALSRGWVRFQSTRS